MIQASKQASEQVSGYVTVSNKTIQCFLEKDFFYLFSSLVTIMLWNTHCVMMLKKKKSKKKKIRLQPVRFWSLVPEKCTEDIHSGAWDYNSYDIIYSTVYGNMGKQEQMGKTGKMIKLARSLKDIQGLV